MNVILIEPQELTDGNTVSLSDRRHIHIHTVLQCRQGDSVRIGLINGPLGKGHIEETTPAGTKLRTAFNEAVPPLPAIDLILALPRPIMLKRILSQTATLGVGKVFLINANRVEKSFFHSSLLEVAAIREQLLLGLEQAVDTRLPAVSIHQRFRPFVEDFLPGIIRDYGIHLVAHPASDLTLGQVLLPAPESRILLAVGPEGGWVEFEVDRFGQQGFRPFHIGPRILRVETAVTALLAQLDLLRQLR